MRIERLVLVYDADGGLAGELRYALGKLRGTARCALCDATHGAVGEKRAWRRRRAALGVPVVALHRDELDHAEQRAVDRRLPCVLASSREGYVRILGRTELEACEGDPVRLYDAIVRALRALALTPP